MAGTTVFFDNNIWSYLAEEDALYDLKKIALRSKVEIVVPPAIVEESRARQNIAARRKVLSLITDKQWKRLLPESFLECAEFKEEVKRLRPRWLNANPKYSEVHRLKYDWTRKVGGFWERARNDVFPPDSDESIRIENELKLARQQSQDIRKRVEKLVEQNGERHLQSIYFLPEGGTAGWNGQPVEYWRATTLPFFLRELSIYTSSYREWVDNEVSIGAMMLDEASFNRFWLHEVSSVRMPRLWLRAAFEFLQQWHKVTQGTPGDSRLAAHLIDARHVISADKNFVRFARRCHEEAPFQTAKSYAISGRSVGRRGTDDLTTNSG